MIGRNDALARNGGEDHRIEDFGDRECRGAGIDCATAKDDHRGAGLGQQVRGLGNGPAVGGGTRRQPAGGPVVAGRQLQEIERQFEIGGARPLAGEAGEGFGNAVADIMGGEGGASPWR